MIPVPYGVRVWLAVGRTDMRKGMNGLALQVQEALGRDLPWIGFHTYGEIAQLAGNAYYHNYTVVLLALYDREPVDGTRGAHTGE